MYASVALAPRLFSWIEIRHDFITNAHQLQALETEIDYLERVRDALESDPEFVRQMAAASIAEDIGETDMIPVSGTLIFGSEEQLQDRMPEIQVPMGTTVVRRFASDRQLRSLLLACVCLMVIFAFTVLNGTGGRFISLATQLTVAVVRWPVARYCRSAPVTAGNETDPQPVRSTTHAAGDGT